MQSAVDLCTPSGAESLFGDGTLFFSRRARRCGCGYRAHAWLKLILLTVHNLGLGFDPPGITVLVIAVFQTPDGVDGSLMSSDKVYW